MPDPCSFVASLISRSVLSFTLVNLSSLTSISLAFDTAVSASVIFELPRTRTPAQSTRPYSSSSALTLSPLSVLNSALSVCSSISESGRICDGYSIFVSPFSVSSLSEKPSGFFMQPVEKTDRRIKLINKYLRI